ncbi:LPXTG cell wall anchor domain-containing protein [Kitasatospora sp. NPDC058201]|uniref:LPXTG cell wall anchor domain-containing protein n=1 Tax=unclassified Kitasatospora TaxID=2633591 RepID=UPI003646FDB1
MSARPLTRRSRLLATATLVVAAGTSALAPATAFADTPAPSASATAAASDTPAPSTAQPLTATLEPAAGQAPLTRGGVGATLTMTVTNNSDQERPFHPAVTVTPVGAAPTGWNWIDFSAKAISAPATYGLTSFNGSNFSGHVVPENRMSHVPFTVPARTTYSWAVSFTLRAALPADDTAVKVALVNDLGNSTAVEPVTLPVASPTGALVQKFTNNLGTVSYKKPFETDLDLTNNGAAIGAAINPTLRFSDGSRPISAVLKLEVSQGGAWVTVPGSDNVWKLPPVTGGLGKGASHRYKVRLSLTGYTGQWSGVSGSLSLDPDTDQGPVDTILKASVTLDGNGAPSISPSASPSTATAKPSPTATTAAPTTSTTRPSPTATTRTPDAQVVPAAANTPSAPAAANTTAPAGTNLAATGAGNSGALFGAGAALVLLGAGAVLYAKRRRTASQG